MEIWGCIEIVEILKKYMIIFKKISVISVSLPSPYHLFLHKKMLNNYEIPLT